MNARVLYRLATEAPRVFGAARHDRTRLEALGRRRLAWLLDVASQTPFYAPLLARGVRSRSPSEMLHALPPLGKEALRDAGAAGLRGGAVRPSWFSTRSSGSTGEPFRVHYDPRGWVILKYLVKARARWLCGVRPGQRIAIVDAPPEDGRVRSPARGWPVRQVSALQTPDAIAAALTAFRPAAIYGLPSVLLEVAGASEGRIRPRTLFTSGELLTARIRARLGEAYGCRVHDVYGSTETKEIAWECLQGSLHVNADVLHVEVLDDAGQPAPEGTEGRITVTVLVNSAMPLLRYQPGDRGRLVSGSCACGLAFPRLGVVTGREVEYLDLGEGVRVSPYQLTCAVEQARGVGRYQVIQRGVRDLLVKAEPLPGADPHQLMHEVREAVTAAIPVAVAVEILLSAHIERPEAGKFQVVKPLAAARPENTDA